MAWPPTTHQDVEDEVGILLDEKGAATVRGDMGTNLVKVGQVLTKGAATDWDNHLVESPVIGIDPASGRWAMTYVGYNSDANGVLTARVGLAYSKDKTTWVKAGQIFAGSGVAGDPDEKGTSGPVWVYEDGTYHLFYIGLTATGYEGGTKRICRASATSLAGPWTRHGAVVSPGGGAGSWYESQVWHPNLIKRGATWYMFFNATAGDGMERIGYATATTLAGPWTVNATAVLNVGATGAWDDKIVGDPCVRRIGDLWVMDYYGYNQTNDDASDGVAITTDDAFPGGWIKHPSNPILTSSTTYDGLYAHKPWTMVAGGTVLHYYTAVAAGGERSVALAAAVTVGSGALGDSALKITATNTTDTPSLWVTQKSGASNSSTVVVGDDIKVATASGRARLQLGSTNGNSELLVGQASNKALLFNWIYNATVANAVANLETYGGGNELRIQNNAGATRVGGTNGKVGFMGAVPVARPVLDYSRTGESVPEAALRTALATLGLVTDSTVA